MRRLFVRSSYVLLLFGIIITTLLITTMAAYAQGPSDLEKPPPEEVTNRYGKCELDNILDPNSPNYDPSQRYGAEGTRFGPIKESSKHILNEERLSRIQYYFGTYVYYDEDIEKIWARQKISTSLELENTNDALYAPTLMAPNYSRLESVAYYFHNGSSTQRYWKVFDHYNHSFIWATSMDASFCSRYVNSNYVSTQILKSSGYWKVYLYDWIDSEWDLCTAAYGDGDHQYGWDVWECYNLEDDWPDLPEIRSYYLRVYVDGAYYDVTSTYGAQWSSLPGDFPYDHDMNYNYYDWYVGP